MKRPSTRSDIVSAEYRLAQSKRESRASFAQVRSALRSRLAQPSSLLVATGLGALLGVWFARRNKPPVEQQGVSAWTPIIGLLSTLLIRFAMQRLADAWARSGAADPLPSSHEPPEDGGLFSPSPFKGEGRDGGAPSSFVPVVRATPPP